MLNATGSRAVRAFHGLAAAIIVFGWSVSTAARTPQDPTEITASASDPAGYIVLPKIVVQTSAGQLPPADDISVDTRYRLPSRHGSPPQHTMPKGSKWIRVRNAWTLQIVQAWFA